MKIIAKDALPKVSAGIASRSLNVASTLIRECILFFYIYPRAPPNVGDLGYILSLPSGESYNNYLFFSKND
jgi:hypothetical protein